MAVTELDVFRKYFDGYEDCYTIIGGTACEILMSEAELDFRATKDIDMIILLEDRYQEFAQRFWAFIKEGGYRCGWKQGDKPHFYRFTKPKSGYPVQIELFSRKPDYHLEADTGIIPVHIDDDTSSLSAILLDEDFYEFMMMGRRSVDGVSVLAADHIIPFKMYAWLDLMEKKSAGEHVDSRDLKKHKYDVFRLLQIVPDGTTIETSGAVNKAIVSFLDSIKNDDLNLRSIGLEFTKEQGLDLLHQIYDV